MVKCVGALLLAYAVYTTAAPVETSYADNRIVILSNNDLNSANMNRASALFVQGSGFTCSEATKVCENLQETILPAPGNQGLTSEQLAEALTGARNGANVDKAQKIWIAGKG